MMRYTVCNLIQHEYRKTLTTNNTRQEENMLPQEHIKGIGDIISLKHPKLEFGLADFVLAPCNFLRDNSP